MIESTGLDKHIQSCQSAGSPTMMYSRTCFINSSQQLWKHLDDGDCVGLVVIGQLYCRLFMSYTCVFSYQYICYAPNIALSCTRIQNNGSYFNSYRLSGTALNIIAVVVGRIDNSRGRISSFYAFEYERHIDDIQFNRCSL